MATFVVAHGAWSSGWRHEKIDATHNPHITAPYELLDILLRLAAD